MHQAMSRKRTTIPKDGSIKGVSTVLFICLLLNSEPADEEVKLPGEDTEIVGQSLSVSVPTPFRPDCEKFFRE